jgi:hypothetical protein
MNMRSLLVSRTNASLSLGVILSLTAGCGSLSKFQIAIDSDPRGARVECNGDYIGETPATYLVPGNKDRSFNGNWVQGSMIEFVATPPSTATNLFVAKKVFRPSAFFQQGDHIPEKMFFDLRRKSEGLLLNLSP